MTVDQLESEIRASLEGWAGQVNVDPPPAPSSTVNLAREPWRMPWQLALVGAGVMLFTLALVLVHGTSGQRVVVSGAGPGVKQAGLGPAPESPPFILLDDPDWQVVYFTTGPSGQERYTEYQFASAATSGSLQISFYAPGSRTGPVAAVPVSPLPSASSSVGGIVDVRGAQAVVTNEVPPRWRLDWQEGGMEWEADGSPFPTAQNLAKELAAVRVVDGPTWQAGMAGGLLAAITSHPSDFVTWHAGGSVDIVPPDPQATPTAPLRSVEFAQQLSAPGGGPWCTAAGQPYPTTGPVPVGGANTPCFASQSQMNAYLVQTDGVAPDPVPTNLVSFALKGDAKHPYCGGQAPLCFTTAADLAAYQVQGAIISVANGHATYATIVVPTDTVVPAG